MRNRILALAALAAAIGSPVAAQAQSSVTVGVSPSSASVPVTTRYGPPSHFRTALPSRSGREPTDSCRSRRWAVTGSCTPARS